MTIIGPDRDRKVFLSTDRGENRFYGVDTGKGAMIGGFHDYALVSSDGTYITIYDGGNIDNAANIVWSGTPDELKSQISAQAENGEWNRTVYAQDLIDLNISN